MAAPLPKVNQLAYRVWRDLAVPPSLIDVRLRFLNRLRDVVEASTELIGTALFALLGGVADPAGTGRDGWPALGNGLSLAVLVYMTAKVSGGKLNPAVSLGLAVARSISPERCLLEMGMQSLGGVIGAGLSKYLTAGTLAGDSPGCFVGAFGVGGGQVFLWELITTFVLVSVVFATAVDDSAAEHFVSIAPLAIGLSLFACAQASGPFTGGCLNPARWLGAAVAFADHPDCGPRTSKLFPAYVLGELIGGALAGLLFRLRLTLQVLYKEHLAGMPAAGEVSAAAAEADEPKAEAVGGAEAH